MRFWIVLLTVLTLSAGHTLSAEAVDQDTAAFCEEVLVVTDAPALAAPPPARSEAIDVIDARPQDPARARIFRPPRP